MNLKTKVHVMGESDIIEGDVVTMDIVMTRLNLKPGESAGPVHAPYFPDLKFEEWWLFLVDKRTGKVPYA